MKPLVSIIIPTYNRAHLMGETLDSIIAQTHSNWECIVVDDGSNDATEELMKCYCDKDSRFHYYKRPLSRPKGANACRNYGFEKSNGEYINWFDSDDIMHPDKLAIQLSDFVNSNFNFSVCQTLIFSKSLNNIIGLRHEKIHSENTFQDYIEGNISWLTQSPIWRKSFLLKYNYLFNEQLKAAQEWEFHSRILSAHPIYHVINQPLVYIREHNDSISYNTDVDNRKWNYFLARVLIYTNQSINLDLRIRKYLQYYLLKEWKSMVIDRNFLIALKAFGKFIVLEKKINFINKVFGLISIFTYSFLNKGHVFLKKVNYTK